MIKNIVFDIGNVLVQYSPRDVLKNYTNSEEDTEILLKEIFKSQEWQDLDWGRLTYLDATERMVNRLPERLEQTCRDIMETWITYALVNQKIVDIAKELKEKGYKLYLLSKMNTYVYEYLKTLEFRKYFEGAEISGYDKVAKPDPKSYELLFEKYNLKPEECLFIDDDDTSGNIRTALSLGMKALKLNPNDDVQLREFLEKENIL